MSCHKKLFSDSFFPIRTNTVDEKTSMWLFRMSLEIKEAAYATVARVDASL